MIKNYFADIPENRYNNFREVLDLSAKQYGDNEALLVREGENQYKSWNYKELKAVVDRVAGWLLSKGYKAGDRVGLLSENRPEWCISWLAVVASGITIVPFDVMQKSSYIEKVAEFSQVKGLFVSASQIGKCESFISSLPSLENVFVFDSIDNNDYIPFTTLSSYTGKKFCMAEDIPLDSTASIIFTSGTTGNPKGVMLSQKGILENINASIMSLPISAADNFVAVLPFHHTYPTTCSFLSPLTVGGRITIVDKIVGPLIIANVKETNGTIVIGVPLLFDKIKRGMLQKFSKIKGFSGFMLKMLLGFSGFAHRQLNWQVGKSLMKSVREKAGLGSIRILVAGGGPLSPDTARFFGAMGFIIVQGYGMSENGPLISTNTVNHNNYESVGLTVKRTDIQIRNKNKEGIGEIIVKSPSLMQGYYNNDEATQEVFTKDGFLKTGDLGRFDKKGFLYITGRIKNLIVSSGGKNIYPEEIEAAFSDSSVIEDILIVGKPLGKSNKGEAVMALVRPDLAQLKERFPAVKLTDEFILPLIQKEVNTVNSSLERHKRVLTVQLHAEEFEKTSSMKIKRFLYRQEA